MIFLDLIPFIKANGSFLLQPSTTPSLPVVHPLVRDFSSVHTQNPAASAQQEHKIDPYILLEDDLKDIFEDIRQVSGNQNNYNYYYF